MHAKCCCLAEGVCGIYILRLFQRGMELKDISTKIERTNCVTEFYPETKRPLVRPQINLLKAAIIFAAVLAINICGSCGIIYLLSHFEWHSYIKITIGMQFIIIFLVACIISFLIFAKRIVIFAIRMYQRYAPYDIRSACLFVPNCSEYMVLAIEKYGLVKGIKKGVDRCHRCHFPNGGEDYP